LALYTQRFVGVKPSMTIYQCSINYAPRSNSFDKNNQDKISKKTDFIGTFSNSRKNTYAQRHRYKLTTMENGKVFRKAST